MFTSKILKRKIVGLTIACLLITSFTAHGQRNVIWTHGLQETNQAWQLYAAHWETMRPVINTVNQTYTTNTGMTAAATEIRQDLDNQLGSSNTNPNNIGIAHGAAGLALRQIDGTTSANNKRFGGFITLGTPNHGMYFANTKSNGELAAYTADATYKLQLPKSVEVNGKTWTNADFSDYAQNFSVQYLGNNLATNQTAIDLKTNSSFITNLPSRTANSKPMINVYGDELSKSQWRLISSFETKPYTLALNATGLEDVLTAANDMEHVYRIEIISSTALSAFHALLSVAAAAAAGVTAVAGVPAASIVFAGALVVLTSNAQSHANTASRAIRARNWFIDADTKWKN